MRNCMEYDGWLSDPLLPNKWLYKPSENKQSIEFIDERGNYLRNKEVAYKFLENNTDDISGMKQFLQNNHSLYNGGKDIDGSWIENDPSVPTGWRMKKIKKSANYTQTQLLSPGRIFFPSHKKALKHMIEKSFPEEEIDDMRN